MSTDPILRDSKERNIFFININLLTPDIRKQNIALSRNNSSIDDLEKAINGNNPAKIETAQTAMRNSKNVADSREGRAIENSSSCVSDEIIIDINQGLEAKEDQKMTQEAVYKVSNVQRLANHSIDDPYVMSQMLIEKNGDRDETCITERHLKDNFSPWCDKKEKYEIPADVSISSFDLGSELQIMCCGKRAFMCHRIAQVEKMNTRQIIYSIGVVTAFDLPHPSGSRSIVVMIDNSRSTSSNGGLET
ncbi:hypothetical protein TNCV_4902351 [Trichonephila clavipes]|nr:hypothetical protein TNCV_4902351 [Trichonephila clavipes]